MPASMLVFLVNCWLELLASGPTLLKQTADSGGDVKRAFEISFAFVASDNVREILELNRIMQK